MYKLVVLLAVVAVASAGIIAPLHVGLGGVSYTQRVQSHVPIGHVGVPLVAKAVVAPVLGYGIGHVGVAPVGLVGHGFIG